MRPHDALIKVALGAPADAAALVRDLLPGTVSDAIVWDSLERERGSFVDAALTDRHSDLLFSARLRIGEPSLAFILVEHQSTSEPAMALRILQYQLQIWDQFCRDHPRTLLPPVIAVLVSHVPGGWTAAHSFDAMFDPRVLAIPGLAEPIPRFSFLVDDLARQSNEDLKARSLAPFQKLALWLLRDGRNPTRLLDNFGSWMPEFAEVRRSRAGIDTLLSYMFRVIDATRLDDLRARLRELESHSKEDPMTIAEHFDLQGRLHVLRRLLVLKFKTLDATDDARLRAATPETVDCYIDRVLVASSLNDVFHD